MPKDKDLKKLVRGRMAKTGESYSIARLRVAGDSKPPKAAKASAQTPAGAVVAGAIYQLKITLSDISPPIWRRHL